MTTADIVFTQPGNPDRLRDYEQNARTIFWALLAAIVIHLLVAFLLAAFSGFFSPALPAPEKPVELTLMDLSPASAASKNSAFIETDESKKAPEPKDKTFESNANSIGASELAAAGGDSNSFAGGVFARCVQRVFLARAAGTRETS